MVIVSLSLSLSLRPPSPQISDQYGRVEVFLGSERVALLGFPQVRVNDGEWHHVLVELQSVKDGKDIKYMALVSLDYGLYEVLSRTHAHPRHRHEPTHTYTQQILHSVCVCVSPEVCGDWQRAARSEAEGSVSGRITRRGEPRPRGLHRMHTGTFLQ